MRLIAFTLQLVGDSPDQHLQPISEAAVRPDVAVLVEGHDVRLVGPPDSIVESAVAGAHVGREDGAKIRCRVDVIGDTSPEAGELCQQVATRFQEGLASAAGQPATRPMTELPMLDPYDSAQLLLHALSEPKATPGGGSAAALAGAAGAALVAMVAGVTAANGRYADAHEEMERIRGRALQLRDELHRLVRTDAEAFAEYLAAQRLPSDTPENADRRRQAMSDSARFATETPLEVMRRSLTVVELASRVARRGARAAVTDAAVAALLAGTAVRAAWSNVRVNLPAVKDLELRAHLSAEAGSLASQAEEAERHAVRASEVDER